MTQMFIPKKIKIGFQARTDTFTGKLSYIIYYDEKGKLRKEDSWNGWRDQDIEVLEFDNTPNTGYIFNKGIKRDGYWGSGRSVIRVYDPRDFEFEISVDNLMGILMHSDVSKRDIVEPCIFAWSGKELVLLPVNSQEYEESVRFTQKQDQKLSSKDLVEGYTYQAKKLDTPLIYMGQREWFDIVNGYQCEDTFERKWTHCRGKKHFNAMLHETKGKKHIFYDGKNFITKTASDLSAILVNEVCDNYATLVDTFFTTIHSQKIVGVVTENIAKNNVSNYFLCCAGPDSLSHARLEFQRSKQNDENVYYFELKFYNHILSYCDSLKLIQYTQASDSVFIQNIKKEFSKAIGVFKEFDDIDKNKEYATKWLKENGLFNSFSYVLENGGKIIGERL